MAEKCAACGVTPGKLNVTDDGALLCNDCFAEIRGQAKPRSIIPPPDVERAMIRKQKEEASGSAYYTFGWIMFALSCFVFVVSSGVQSVYYFERFQDKFAEGASANSLIGLKRAIDNLPALIGSSVGMIAGILLVVCGEIKDVRQILRQNAGKKNN